MKAKTLKLIEEALVGGFREAGLSLSGEARSFVARLTASEQFQRVRALPDHQMLASVIAAAILLFSGRRLSRTRPS